jgi:protein SCO1/2
MNLILRGVLALVVAVAANVAYAAPARPLPTDSIYQLPAPLTDQDGRTADWGTRRGRPQLVAMFYTSCQ